MKKFFALLLCLFALPAAAQDLQLITANSLPMNFYVAASGGDDSSNNQCQSASTPCATIQGAINKIPRIIKNTVVVNVAAGNYKGAVLEGFTFLGQVGNITYGAPVGGGGALVIQGTFQPATLAQGVVTGQLTSVAQRSNFKGQATVSGANWAVNDLRGKFLRITGGTGFNSRFVPPAFLIQSNTSTVMNFGDEVNFYMDSTTTFEIDTNATHINTGAPYPNNTQSPTNYAGLFIGGNSSNIVNITPIRILGIDFNASGATYGIDVNSGPAGASFAVTDCSFSGTGFVIGILSGGFIQLTDNYASIATGGTRAFVAMFNASTVKSLVVTSNVVDGSADTVQLEHADFASLGGNDFRGDSEAALRIGHAGEVQVVDDYYQDCTTACIRSDFAWGDSQVGTLYVNTLTVQSAYGMLDIMGPMLASLDSTGAYSCTSCTGYGIYSHDGALIRVPPSPTLATGIGTLGDLYVGGFGFDGGTPYSITTLNSAGIEYDAPTSSRIVVRSHGQ
jgi:hypothetical protein